MGRRDSRARGTEPALSRVNPRSFSGLQDSPLLRKLILLLLATTSGRHRASLARKRARTFSETLRPADGLNMENAFFEHPILNSPYESPARHWELDKQGQPTQRILDSRRPAQFITPIPRPRKRK